MYIYVSMSAVSIKKKEEEEAIYSDCFNILVFFYSILFRISKA